MKKVLNYGGWFLFLVLLFLVYHYFDQTKSVRYVVDDGRGKMYEQIWKQKGEDVSFSSSEGKLIGLFSFGHQGDSYFERHEVSGISSLYFF